MRDYSKISAAFWTGKTGKKLRGDVNAQVVSLYLMTCPSSNMIGVFYCPISYISHDTGIPLDVVKETVSRLCGYEFCTYDDDAEIIWVHEMARYQIGDQSGELSAKDNQVKGIQKQFDTIAVDNIRHKFFIRYHKSFHLTDHQKSIFESVDKQAPCKPLASPSEGVNHENTTSNKGVNEDNLALKKPDGVYTKNTGENTVNIDLKNDTFTNVNQEVTDFNEVDIFSEINKPLASPLQAPPKPGTGTGTGTGAGTENMQPRKSLENHEQFSHTNTTDDDDKFIAGKICKAIKDLGITSVNPSHVHLQSLIARGVIDLDVYVNNAKVAIEMNKPHFQYILKMILNQLADGKVAPSVMVDGDVVKLNPSEVRIFGADKASQMAVANAFKVDELTGRMM